MTDNAIDICFLDTETLGLDPDAPVWEFAAIRRITGWPSHANELEVEFCIQHDPTGWLDDFPAEFANDYRARYDSETAYDERTAAECIHSITRGAKIIGCNPGFDLERLAKLLKRHDLTPEWHYHPLDITSIAVGYYTAVDEKPAPGPWRSEQMAECVGIATGDFNRHTAMGDVLWTRAQWDAVMSA